jgi:O-antigen ligase
MTTASPVPPVAFNPALRSFQPEGVGLQETRWFSWLRIGVVTLLCAAPFAFGAVQAWAWSALAIVSLVLLVCWAIGCALQKRVVIQWLPLYIPALLILLLGVIQFTGGLSLDKIGTREALIKFTTDVVLFFLVGQLFATSSKRVWEGFGLTVTSYAFALSIFAIVQFFSSPDLVYWSIKPQWGGAIFGPYINHNHYAGLMEMLLPIAGAYVLAVPGHSPLRWLGAFSVLVAFASVELSGSRGGVISLLIEMAIFGWVFGRSRLFGNRRIAAISAAGAVSVGAILILMMIAPPEILERYQTLIKSPDLTFGMRTQMAKDTLHIFRDYPLIGTGLGTLETVYPQYQTVFPDRVVEHAHNDFAELAAETGLTGLVLAIAAAVIFFSTGFGKIGSKVNELGGSIRLGAAISCCGILLHSFSDFNLHIPANVAWFAACAAISQLPFTARRREHASRGSDS